jgi:CBS domain-containing protein
MATTVQPYRSTYLIPAFERASVADVMRPGVLSCAADTPLAHVAEMMAIHRVHAVVVADTRVDAIDGERLVWGFVSDMDIVRAARRGSIGSLTAGAIANTEARTVEPRTPLAEAARVMDEHGVSHLVVVTGGYPIAVVSTLDLAGALAWGGS